MTNSRDRRRPNRIRNSREAAAVYSRQKTHTDQPRRTLRPDPQSQSFSRSYGSILPTSLIYIILSTRGYTPWRPDAVMSTPGGANTTGTQRYPVTDIRIFKGRRERTGHAENPCALPTMEPYLRVNRFQGKRLLTRKDNSPRGSLRRLRTRLCYHISTSRPRNINRVPF